MPSKADQRNRLKQLAKRQHISLAELKNRLKSGQEGEDPALPPEEDIIVSRDTQDCTSPLSNAQEGEECGQDEEEGARA